MRAGSPAGFGTVAPLAFFGLALALGVLLLVAEPGDAQSASQVKFIVQPQGVPAGEPFASPVKVGVYDSSNNLVTSSTATITLTLQSPQSPSSCPGTFGGMTRPCGRLLYGAADAQQGSVQATASSGIATFDNLRVDAIGKGYRIDATSGSLTSATSRYFDVSAGPAWPQFHGDGTRTASTTFSTAMASPTVLTDLTVQTGRPIASSPLIVDLDRDGLMDAVVAADFSNVASGTPTVQAFRQSPAGSYSTYWTYTSFAAFSNVKDGKAVLAVGDLDADNSPEVVVYDTTFTYAGALAFPGEHVLRVLSGTSGTLLASWTPAGLLSSPIAPAIGDVDGDGTNEIVVQFFPTAGSFADGATAFAVLEYASGSLTATTFTLPTVTSPDIAALGTCTGYPQYMTAPPVLAEFRSSHAGLEIVLGTDNTVGIYGCNGQPVMPVGRVHVCFYTTTITCPETVPLPGTLSGPNSDQATRRVPEVKGLAAADLDGDGLTELVVNAGHVEGQALQTTTLIVLRTSASLAVASSRDDGYLWNTAALGDVDGDGKNDIANVKFSLDPADPKAGDVSVRGFASGAIVNKGTLARPAPSGGSSESSGGGALLSLDYTTGATRTMEYVFGSDDSTIVATTGGAAGPVNPAVHWTSPTTSGVPLSPPALGDLTGDCRPEILVGMANGNVAHLTGSAASVPGTPSLSVIMGPPYASPGSGKQAKLFWTVPADGGLPILSYRVYRATTSTGTYSEVGVWRGVTAPVSGAEFIDDLATPGYGDYYYKVSAINCVGESTLSASFHAEVKPAQTPTSLVGVVGDTATPAHKVQLTWEASAANVARPNGCGPVDEYWVFRGTASTFAPDITGFTDRIGTVSNGVAVPPTQFTYTDTSAAIQTDGDYYYKLMAKNCVANSTATAAFWAEVKVAQAPSALATTVTQSPLKVALTWTASPSNSAGPNGCGGVLQYKVYRSTNLQAGPFTGPALATVTAPIVSYDDTALAVGNHYYYKVSAVNCVGEGSLAPSANGVLADIKVPNAVALTATGMTSTTIDLLWTNPGDPVSDGAGVGVSKYNVFWVQGPGPVTTSDAQISPDPLLGATTRTHTGLTVDLQYCYAMRAVDQNGNVGALGTQRCATTPDTTPPAAVPSLIATGSSVQKVTLDWTSTTDNLAVTGYRAYYRTGPGVVDTDNAISLPLSPLSYEHTGLSPGDYCYRMAARDAAGNVGPMSPEACATVIPSSPPTFAPGADVSVLEDSGITTISAWATSIDPGLPAPPGVKVSFVATSDNPALFTLAPTISPSTFTAAPWAGTLSFQPAANRCGTALVTVYLQNDVVNPSNRSLEVQFPITVACVNDAPVFTPGAAVVDVGHEDGMRTFANWATAIAQAPASAANERTGPSAQQAWFTTTVSEPSVFSVLPSVTPVVASAGPWPGDLSFAPALGQFGSSTVTICLRDDGGTANGGVDATCSTLQVNVHGPPTAEPDCYSTSGRLAVAAPGVSANDHAVNGASPQAQLVTPPQRASSFFLRADGSFEYVPASGFTGQDMFQYRAVAGPYRSEPVAVCIDVHAAGTLQAPTAAFGYAPVPAMAGQEVMFWDASHDTDGTVTSWAWDFGDASAGDGRSPTHVFERPGLYRVSLMVIDDSGLSHTGRQTVLVLAEPLLLPLQEPVLPEPEVPKKGTDAPRLPEIPTPGDDEGDAAGQGPVEGPKQGFTALPVEGIPLAWAFTPNELSAKGYNWDFGDDTKATGATAQHQFPAAGTYEVTLTFEADGNTQSFTEEVQVLGSRSLDEKDEVAGTTETSGLVLPALAWAGMGAVLLLVVAGPAVYLVLRRRAKPPV